MLFHEFHGTDCSHHRMLSSLHECMLCNSLINVFYLFYNKLHLHCREINFNLQENNFNSDLVHLHRQRMVHASKMIALINIVFYIEVTTYSITHPAVLRFDWPVQMKAIRQK